MEVLPDGEKNSKISLFVLTQLTNVTDTHTDRQTHIDKLRMAALMHRIARQKRKTTQRSNLISVEKLPTSGVIFTNWQSNFKGEPHIVTFA